eukprot:Lankesteria_metandrocarpae@DN10380_c0_g1_i1.p1
MRNGRATPPNHKDVNEKLSKYNDMTWGLGETEAKKMHGRLISDDLNSDNGQYSFDAVDKAFLPSYLAHSFDPNPANLKELEKVALFHDLYGMFNTEYRATDMEINVVLYHAGKYLREWLHGIMRALQSCKSVKWVIKSTRTFSPGQIPVSDLEMD